MNCSGSLQNEDLYMLGSYVLHTGRDLYRAVIRDLCLHGFTLRAPPFVGFYDTQLCFEFQHIICLQKEVVTVAKPENAVVAMVLKMNTTLPSQVIVIQIIKMFFFYTPSVFKIVILLSINNLKQLFREFLYIMQRGSDMNNFQ